jgi:hypothetical protein
MMFGSDRPDLTHANVISPNLDDGPLPAPA